MPDSPRRFRVPGPFVWHRINERRWATAPCHEWIAFINDDPQRAKGDRFFAKVVHPELPNIGIAEYCANVDDAKSWCEAEVARVSASMMVEVEGENE